MKTRVLLLISIVALVPSIYGCTDTPPERKDGSITIVVSDENTLEQLDGVAIQLLSVDDPSVSFTGRTDGYGLCPFSGIPVGSYKMDISKPGYEPRKGYPLKINGGENPDMEIVLKSVPEPLTISPTVLDFGESVIQKGFSLKNPNYKRMSWKVMDTSVPWIVRVTDIDGNKSGSLEHDEVVSMLVTIDRNELAFGNNESTLVILSGNEGHAELTIKAYGADRSIPTTEMQDVFDVDMTTAKFEGFVVNKGASDDYERGFVYSTSPIAEDATSGYIKLPAEMNSDMKYYAEVKGLNNGTKYYVRAYGKNSIGMKLSVTYNEFTTIESYPQVRTDKVTGLNLTNNTCSLNGYLVQKGNPAPIEIGFCISDNGEPTTDDRKCIVSGIDGNEFHHTLSGLAREREYRVRAYAIQEGRTFYGSTMQFDTKTTTTEVATMEPSQVNYNTYVLKGSILNDGNPPYSERGFCYSITSSDPEIDSNKIPVSSPTSSADFNYRISGLELNKTYHIRAYAIQDNTPQYGEEKSFQTLFEGSKVITLEPSDVKYYEMTLRGRIDAEGIPKYDEIGFIYSESTSFVSSKKKSVSYVDSDGVFECHLTGLTPHTRYYYRAYVIQAGNTIPGDIKDESTPWPPMVVTTDAYAKPDEGMMNISWTVELTGAYGFKGEPECNDFGFVYGPGNNPTADNTYGYTVVPATSIEPFANGQGSFSVVLKNMPGNTKYYYRAYAWTPYGYTYGDVMTFNTQPVY